MIALFFFRRRLANEVTGKSVNIQKTLDSEPEKVVMRKQPPLNRSSTTSDVPVDTDSVVMRRTRMSRSSTDTSVLTSQTASRRADASQKMVSRIAVGSGVYDESSDPGKRASTTSQQSYTDDVFRQSRGVSSHQADDDYATIDEIIGVKSNTPEVNGVLEDDAVYDDILNLEPPRAISPLPYGALSREELQPLQELKDFLQNNINRGSRHASWTEDAVAEMKELISSLN